MVKVKRNYGSIAVTLLVLFMVLISGPANAVLVNVISAKTSYGSGDTQIVFDASVDIRTPERVPIQNLTFYVYNGSTVVDSVTFNPLGIIIGTSSNFTVQFTSGASSLGLAYGYGYGAGYGYDSIIGSGYYFFYNGTGYDNGYGYGYQTGYGYGTSYGSLLRYNITWNLTSATPSDGSYTGRLAAFASDLNRYGYGYVSSGYTTSHYYNSSDYSFTLSRAAAVAGAPSIIGFAPTSPVTDIAGATRTFNVTLNQTANVTWYINGTQVQAANTSVTSASYTNTSAAAGTWIVNATATNANGTASNLWTWIVSPAVVGAPSIIGFAPASPVNDSVSPATRTFNITVNQSVNVSWVFDGTQVQAANTSVTSASYTNTASAGRHNVTAVASNANGSASKSWAWNIGLGVSLTADSASKTTVNYRNASYILTVNNTGNIPDSYTLSVSNPNAALFAALNRTTITNLAAGASTAVRLDVGGAAGTYIVNVTATSQANASTTATVSTTTIVVAGPYIAITSLTLNQSENGTATITIYNTNFSAGVNVFVNNTPSVARMTASKSAVEATKQFGLLVATVSGNDSGWIRLVGTETAPGLSSPVRVANLTYNATGNQGDTTALSLGLISLPNYTNGGAPTNELVTQAGILNGILHIRDLIPPQINSVTLNKTTVNASEPIHVTVNATDNVGVTSVTVVGGASTVSLTQTSTNIWEGDITAKSTSSTVTVTASDADGNRATASTSYTVSAPGALPPPLSISFVSPPTPVDNATVTTNYANVSISLNRDATQATLYWNGVAKTMNGSGTSWYRNMTFLLSGNYTYSVTATAGSEVATSGIRRVTVALPVQQANFTTNATGYINSGDVVATAPAGNVNIFIPNGTRATVNGTPISNISIESSQLTGAMATAPSGKGFLGVNVNLTPDGAQFNPYLNVTFYYTDDMWQALGITDENSLEVRFYNRATGDWESGGIEIWPNGRDTVNNSIKLKVTHFSTFAIMGAVPTGAPSVPGAGGGAGGGGGGGVVTSEPYDNIAKYERQDKNLIANTPVTYTFTVTEHGIYEIVVTGKENENDIAIRVEALKGTSKLVATSAPGAVNKNVNIWAGTKKIKEALVRFKVENTWITSNSFVDSDVKMLKWDGSRWAQLETTQKTKDNTYTYYEAKTDTFSSFAISGAKGGAVVATPTVTPMVTETPKPVTPAVTTPAVTPPVKLSAIPTWVYALIIIVIIAVAAYFFVIRKKEEKK